MSSISSYPGAILFRFILMVVLILVLIAVFMSYADETQRDIERISVLQTGRVVNSAMAVVFSTYAVNNELDKLNDLDGGNPFVHLAEYQMLPTAYQGVVERDPDSEMAPGWYYMSHRRLVIYKARYLAEDIYFELVLLYSDANGSGRFESRVDKINSLKFVKRGTAPGEPAM